MKIHVKKNDKVIVLSGNYKGNTGRVLKVFPGSSKILVENVNMVHKHTKPNQKNQQGGIVEKEAPLHISNIMVVCPSCSKPTKVARKRVFEEKLNRKVGYRVCKKCGEIIRTN